MQQFIPRREAHGGDVWGIMTHPRIRGGGSCTIATSTHRGGVKKRGLALSQPSLYKSDKGDDP